MLGMFHLLPLLKGWEYKMHVAERAAVVRGAPPIEVSRISETGWLIAIGLLTDDAYGTLIIEYQGADLETRAVRVCPESAKAVGAFAQDPGGWLQKYYRPNPNSTAGVYYTVGFSGGFQGAVFPYVPTVVLKLYLDEKSTQETAYVRGAALVIAITDPKAFIQSLRRVLWPFAPLKIDPALLVHGPARFEEVEEAKK